MNSREYRIVFDSIEILNTIRCWKIKRASRMKSNERVKSVTKRRIRLYEWKPYPENSVSASMSLTVKEKKKISEIHSPNDDRSPRQTATGN